MLLQTDAMGGGSERFVVGVVTPASTTSTWGEKPWWKKGRGKTQGKGEVGKSGNRGSHSQREGERRIEKRTWRVEGKGWGQKKGGGGGDWRALTCPGTRVAHGFRLPRTQHKLQRPEKDTRRDKNPRKEMQDANLGQKKKHGPERGIQEQKKKGKKKGGERGKEKNPRIKRAPSTGDNVPGLGKGSITYRGILKKKNKTQKKEKSQKAMLGGGKGWDGKGVGGNRGRSEKNFCLPSSVDTRGERKGLRGGSDEKKGSRKTRQERRRGKKIRPTSRTEYNPKELVVYRVNVTALNLLGMSKPTGRKGKWEGG